eukprot:scaffold6572_cov106-Cylindrotheca_fusiformis.AAC.5
MTGLNSVTVGSAKEVCLVRVFHEKFAAIHEQQSATDGGDVNIWVKEASRLLSEQWPKGGTVAVYSEKIIQETNYGTSTELYALPCSYILVEGNRCIGHGRLTECFESAGGNAAAATFIVVSHNVRGRGFGSLLMSLLELEAERLGFHYIYLWTRTAIGFYEKIGYTKCERVSLKRACLKKLASNEVESLEAVLIKHRATIGDTPALRTTNEWHRQKETILLPPGDDESGDAEDVWLRKRLVEQVGSIHIPLKNRLEEMKIAFDAHPRSNELEWCYRILLVPWQAQIGPSCGLAALRMTREYFLTRALSESANENQHLPSLLGEAQERGFTKDGEVFDANHLRQLAAETCGIDCDTLSVKELTPQRVERILADGGLFILPYDSNGRTRLPAKFNGRRAHYGIIVGMAIGLETEAATNVESIFPRLRQLQENERDYAFSSESRENTYLFVQQSLSSNLSIASWSDFMESNDQLVCVDETKFGSTTLDLRDRIIVCRRLHPHVLSDS